LGLQACLPVGRELQFSCSDKHLWSVTAKVQTAADGKKSRLRQEHVLRNMLKRIKQLSEYRQ